MAHVTDYISLVSIYCSFYVSHPYFLSYSFMVGGGEYLRDSICVFFTSLIIENCLRKLFILQFVRAIKTTNWCCSTRIMTKRRRKFILTVLDRDFITKKRSLFYIYLVTSCIIAFLSYLNK